jgi:DNA-directed RNA polymerase specialized sigma24 family protein
MSHIGTLTPGTARVPTPLGSISYTVTGIESGQAGYAGFQASPLHAMPATDSAQDFRSPVITRAPRPLSDEFFNCLRLTGEGIFQNTPLAALLIDQPWTPPLEASSKWRVRWWSAAPPFDHRCSVWENLGALEAFAPGLFEASLPQKQFNECVALLMGSEAERRAAAQALAAYQGDGLAKPGAFRALLKQADSPRQGDRYQRLLHQKRVEAFLQLDPASIWAPHEIRLDRKWITRLNDRGRFTKAKLPPVRLLFKFFSQWIRRQMYKTVEYSLCPPTDREKPPKHRIKNEEQLNALALRGGAPSLDHPATGTVRQAQRLIARLDGRDEAHQLLANASPRTQELLTLLAADLSPAEAAARMGISRSTVYNMWSRLKRRARGS